MHVGFIKSDGFGSQLIKRLIQVSHPYRIRVSDLALIPLSQQGINPYLLFQAGENEFPKCWNPVSKLFFEFWYEFCKKFHFLEWTYDNLFRQSFETRPILSPKAVSIIIYLVQDPYFVFVDVELHFFHLELFHQNHPFQCL